jgi:hypothetical protein
VTVRTPWPSADAFASLAARGLVVRTFAHEPLLEGVIRVSVATPDEDDRLLAAIADLLGRAAPAARQPAARPDLRQAGDRLAPHAGDLGAGRALARRQRPHGGRDGRRLPRPHAGGAGLPRSPRPAAGGRRRPPRRRAPHRRGLRAGARPGARSGARGPRRDPALRRRLRPARRGTRALRRRPRRPRRERPGPPPLRTCRRRGRATLWPHMLDSMARAGRVNLHLESRGEDDHHVVEAGLQGPGARPAPRRRGRSATARRRRAPPPRGSCDAPCGGARRLRRGNIRSLRAALERRAPRSRCRRTGGSSSAHRA